MAVPAYLDCQGENTLLSATMNENAEEEKIMNKTATKKTTKKNEYEVLEQERLFGANIDHYMAMNRCLVLSRIFHKAGP